MTSSHQPGNLLNGLREASWLSIGIVLVFDLLGTLLLFANVHPLVVVFLPWVLVIGVGIFLLGKLRFSDLGIFPARIIPAILSGLVIWCIIQILAAAALFFIQGKISWGNVMPGYLVDQLLFFAFAEEIVYRGYLFPQLYLKLKRARHFSSGAYWIALLLSQAIFSLYHIPHRLANNTPIHDLPFQLFLLWISGLLLCYVYLRSQNLFVAVVVHALGNAPSIIFSDATLPWYVLTLIVWMAAITVIEVGRRLPFLQRKSS
ncbi:MAG: CPBP family intramembrane glutamic endopeptidase [Chloroflexota bacterium]